VGIGNKSENSDVREIKVYSGEEIGGGRGGEKQQVLSRNVSEEMGRKVRMAVIQDDRKDFVSMGLSRVGAYGLASS